MPAIFDGALSFRAVNAEFSDSGVDAARRGGEPPDKTGRAGVHDAQRAQVTKIRRACSNAAAGS